MKQTLKPLRNVEVNGRLVAGWILVLIKGPSQPADVESIHEDYARYEEAERWAEEQFGAISYTWDAYGLYMFLFQNPNDAMLFKLRWGLN